MHKIASMQRTTETYSPMQFVRPVVGDLSVLIVDDESQMLGELEEALSDYGFSVRTATSGAIALGLLASEPEIGVMISDIRMPEMDGFELTRLVLAQRAEIEAVEVILITGHASLDDAVSAIHNGAFDFVRKPFRINSIVSACTRAMARAIGRRAIAARLDMPSAATDVSKHVMRLCSAPCTEELMREVQGPLISILGFADMLQRGLTDIEKCATEIRNSAFALVFSIDSLSRLSRAACLDKIGEMRRQAIAPVLAAAVAWEEPLAKAKDTQLNLGRCGEFEVAIDGDMIGKAIRLLLQLVIRMMPDAAVVELSAEVADGRVAIRINGQMPNRAPVPVEAMSDAMMEATRMMPLGIGLLRRITELHQGSLCLVWAERQTVEATLRLPQA